MKKILIILIVIVLVSARIFSQTQVGGIINSNTTWTISNSPYNLTSDITIRGTVLSIESGVTVNLGTNQIFVNGTNSSPADLFASGVLFTGSSTSLSSYIDFNGYSSTYLSGGTLDNCSFSDLYLNFQDNSHPTISNSTLSYSGTSVVSAFRFTNGSWPTISGNTLSGFNYPFSISGMNSPAIGNNNTSGCINQFIGLSGTFTASHTLFNYNYQYYLIGDITITGSSLYIDPGVTINLGANQIFVNANSSSSANLNASGVLFTGSSASLSAYIDFNGYSSTRLSGGTLDNCSFSDLYLNFQDNTNPTISNSTLTYSGTSAVSALKFSSGSSPVITGNIISGFNYPFHITGINNPSIYNNITSGCVNQYIGLSGTFASDYYLPIFNYPFYLTGDITINGSTLSIDSGLTVNMGSNQIFVNSTNSSPANFNANGVTFTGSSASLSASIDFNGYSSTYLSGGTLDNCSFSNLYFNFQDNSNPIISNSIINNSLSSGTAFQAANGGIPSIHGNIIRGFKYSLSMANESKPVFTNNDINGCTTQFIALSGTFSKNFDLPDYGFEFALTSALSISGAIFSLPNGTKINLGTYGININSYNNGINSRLASINGTDIFFKSTASTSPVISFTGYIYNSIQYPAGGNFSHCSFDNITLSFKGNSNPIVSNSKLFGSKLAVSCTSDALPIITYNDFFNNTTAFNSAGSQIIDASNNFWGHQSGPKNSNNPAGQGEVFSGNGNFTPFSTIPINGSISPVVIEPNLSFNPVPVGSYLENQLHITNTGDIDLKITGISSSTNSFISTNKFPIWISKNDTAGITIRFAPIKDGNVQGDLIISTNNQAIDNIIIPVVGTGAKVLELSVSSLDFGQVYLHESKTLDFWIKNLGTNTISIDSIVTPYRVYRATISTTPSLNKTLIAYDENNPAEVLNLKSLSSSAVLSSIIPGDSIRVALTFQPQKYRAYNGPLVIYYNATGFKSCELTGIGYADPLSVKIHSIDFKSFPFLYLNAKVDTLGDGIETLTTDNFKVYEDNILQQNGFVVVQPGQNGGARLADIIFIMDNSSSMSGEQAQVRDNVISFVNELSSSGVNFALGLCRYGISNPVFEDNGSLTTDAEYFKNNVWTRNQTSGSIEPGYQAIQQSAFNFSFRPGAQKIFIIITDETPAQGIVTLSQALSACSENSITLFALTLSNLFTEFTSITTETNGEAFDITSPFDGIFDFIKNIVSSTYLLQYHSSHQSESDQEHKVVVAVNHNGETASDTISYNPGNMPKINRTESTLFLHDQAWGLGTPLNIEAIVIDKVQPFITTVSLFYRTVGQIKYNSVNMLLTSGDIYKASIPTSASYAPGVEYYIQATDGTYTTTNPSVDPITNPYQIAILPNEAPKIVFTKSDHYKMGQSIVISACITDNTNSLTHAYLYFRKQGQLIYSQVELQAIGDTIYSATLLPEYLNNEVIEYYLRAVDDFNVSNYMGWPDSPLIMRVLTIVDQVNVLPLANLINSFTTEIMEDGKLYHYYILHDKSDKPINSISDITCKIQQGKTTTMANGILLGLDTLKITINTNELNLKPGQDGQIQLNDTIILDGQFYKIATPPAPIDISMINQFKTTSFDVFFGGSIGAGLIGGGVGFIATASAAKVSAKASGGFGLNIEIDNNDVYNMSRRFEAAFGLSLECPSISLPVGQTEFGIHFGVTPRVIGGQSLKTNVNDDDPTIKLAKAGFILEIIPLGGINFSPATTVVIASIKALLASNQNAIKIINDRRDKNHFGYGVDFEAGAGINYSYPKKGNNELFKISLIDFSIGGSILNSTINFPNETDRSMREMQGASSFNIEALGLDFNKSLLKNLNIFEFNHINSIKQSASFKNDQIDELAVEFEGSNNIDLLPLNLGFSNYYKEFIIKDNVLNRIEDNVNEDGKNVFIFHKSIPNPYMFGSKLFLSKLDTILNISKRTYHPNDNPILLNSFDDLNYGFHVPFDLNLSAALGIGGEISLGVDFDYLQSMKRLTKNELILEGRKYITEDYNYSYDANYTFLGVTGDLINSITYIIKDSFLQFIEQFKQTVEKGKDFVVKVAESTKDAIVVTGNAFKDGYILLIHYTPQTLISYQLPFEGTILKRAYISTKITNLKKSTNSKDYFLTICSQAYEIDYYNNLEEIQRNFETPILMKLPIIDTVLTNLGIPMKYRPYLKIYKYENGTHGWEEMSSVSKDDTVSAYISESATYALGILTSPQDDQTPPTISNVKPVYGSSMSFYPYIEATIKDEAFGSGLDYSRLAIVMNGDTVDCTWNPDLEMISYEISQSLEHGNYEFEIIAFDNNNNKASVTSSFAVFPTQYENHSIITGLLLFPNPILNSRLTIRFHSLAIMDEIMINLFDLKGNLLNCCFKGKIILGTNEMAIQLDPNLPKGIYFIQLVNQNTNINMVKKIVIQ